MSDLIPDDVMVEILTRLPAKSLLRFRSVSKPWNSLITGPAFITSHLNNHSPTSPNSYHNLPLSIVRQCYVTFPCDARTEHYTLFLDTQHGTFDECQEIPFPMKSRHLHYFNLMGYVRGLFCFYEHDCYHLWNPSIRKSVTIPKPAIKKKEYGPLVDHLGFGFDPRTNDYKVVRCVILCGTKPSEESKVPLVEVYSVNAGSWRMASGAGGSFPVGYRIGFGGHFPPCLEGAVHFAAEARSCWNDKLILSFDLGDEVFKTILLPNGLQCGRDVSTAVFKGLLSLLCCEGDRANKSCSIWMMKEYGVVDSWYKYVKVDLTGGIKRVIGIRSNGHILLERTGRHGWELSSYDPQNQNIENLDIHGVIGNFHVDTFEENLTLLDKTNAVVSRRGRKRKDRWTLDQCAGARMEARTLAADVRRLKHEFEHLFEKVKREVQVAREAMDKNGTPFPQIQPKNVSGNEAINSMRLTATSQDLMVNDCDVDKKLMLIGRSVNIKEEHLIGCSSPAQVCCNDNCLRDVDLEALRNMKAKYAEMLEQIIPMDKIMQTILNSKVPTLEEKEGVS